MREIGQAPGIFQLVAEVVLDHCTWSKAGRPDEVDLVQVAAVGAALFVVFLLGVSVRGARLADPALLWVSAPVCAATVAVAFYGLEAVQLFALAVACGIVLREAAVPQGPTGSGGPS